MNLEIFHSFYDFHELSDYNFAFYTKLNDFSWWLIQAAFM